MAEKIKMVYLDAQSLGDVDLSPVARLGDLKVYQLSTEEEKIERMQGYPVVIVNKLMMDRQTMDACPELKLICISATGMNNIDLEYAKEKGIEVKNVAGYSTESVAQWTFGMIFYILHQTRYYDDFVKNGSYERNPLFTHMDRSFWELKGKTFGIIGLGTIGKRVATIASVFGCRVIYYSTSGKNVNPDYSSVSLEELLKVSDIVSIHAPLNQQTNNLITLQELKLMQSHAILINVGRGGIVNEEDLSVAIDNKIIYGAGVDVYTKEPIVPDHPYLKIRNKDRILLTPHMVWTSMEARAELVTKLAHNISSFYGSR